MTNPNELQTIPKGFVEDAEACKQEALTYIAERLDRWLRAGTITIPSGIPPNKLVEGYYNINSGKYNQALQEGWNNQW